jgi:hypothetical protein
LLFVFNLVETINFYTYLGENLLEYLDDRKLIFNNAQIQLEINNFFGKGKLPKMEYFKFLLNIHENQLTFRWILTSLLSIYNEGIYEAQKRLQLIE